MLVIDTQVGIVTWLVAATHEVPQNPADFGVIVHNWVWLTRVVDLTPGQSLNVVVRRDSASVFSYLANRPTEWCDQVEWVTLDLSGPYRAVSDTMLPHAVQIADPIHVVKLANHVLDETRRRVQNVTVVRRGRRNDPPCRT